MAGKISILVIFSRTEALNVSAVKGLNETLTSHVLNVVT